MQWTAHDRHLAKPRRWCKYGNSGKSRGKHNAWHSHLFPPHKVVNRRWTFPQVFLLTVWPAGDFGFDSHLLNFIFIILIGERTQRSGVGEKSKATNPRKDDNFKWAKSKFQKNIFNWTITTQYTPNSITISFRHLTCHGGGGPLEYQETCPSKLHRYPGWWKNISSAI